MPTGQARTPKPPPLPPAPAKDRPPSPAKTHRRHRTFSSSSSSSSSSLSTVSSAASSPSPSPRGRATTSVPFSWEHHPGIPKSRLPADAKVVASSAPPPTPPLPLPPPLRAPPSRTRHHHHHNQQHSRRRRSSSSGHPPAAGADPFAAALAECTRERAAASGADSDRRLMDSLFPSPAAATQASASCGPSSRRWSIASAGGVAGLLDMYGCKSAMGVAEGAFVVRRPAVVAVVRPGPGRAAMRRAMVSGSHHD